MRTTFESVSGQASTTEGTLVLAAVPHDRCVELVLDDTNWILERALTKRSNKATRSKVPFAGPTKFKLGGGQDLFIFAALATGGMGSEWTLSLLTESEDAS